MPFKVECGTETYRIVGPNGEEGPRVPWGAIASLKIGNELYYCDGDSDADEQVVERVISTRAQDGTDGQHDTTCEDVAFDDEPEEGDDPDDGEKADEEDEEDDDDEGDALRVA